MNKTENKNSDGMHASLQHHGFNDQLKPTSKYVNIIVLLLGQ